MRSDEEEQRLARLEEAVVLLTKLSEPKPKSWWDWVPTEKIRDFIYIIGVPALIFKAFLEFDEYFTSREANSLAERREAAISRLDQLQDINSEIYRLQTEGKGDTAFALIEAKRGQIARLTDTVYLEWQEQPEMLKRFDLNALAEALLVQDRTDDALRVAEAVSAEGLSPIAAIDQQILKARIQFALGPAHDIEAARQHLRDAVPLIDGVVREGSKFLMQEKMLQVRVLNEGWLSQPCEAILPMAVALRELRAFNAEAGATDDSFQSELTASAVEAKCDGQSSRNILP
ncbi:hypothetical protein [Rubrimonas cliftonensis]|uniref:Uncharacterized protein n=1 Tax=Rubrimonas cliftonensis TaxID=89524 RepID=A0A1H4GFE1_9RHOB|nr:hypothetical protein [Rubrimonas cliftonensis]SEB08254.1 hypothetical protein SAMN05444370_1632 [Rubrimonas cliftonensis]